MRSRSADEIRTHPRFVEALACYVNAIIRFFDGNRYLIGLLKDVASLEVAVLLVGFYAVYDESDRTTWATPGRIRQLVADQRLASPRRVDDFLARLIQTRSVTQLFDRHDHRIRILAPTETLLAYDRAYLAALHQPLNLLYPDPWYQEIVAQNARLHLAIRRAEIAALPDRKARHVEHPGIRLFVTRDGGYLALLLTVQAELTHRGLLSFTDIAQRIGVSRTHIRHLFIDAESAGYAELSKRSGSVSCIRPQLWEELRAFIAQIAADRDAIKSLAMTEPGF